MEDLFIECYGKTGSYELDKSLYVSKSLVRSNVNDFIKGVKRTANSTNIDFDYLMEYARNVFNRKYREIRKS